MSDESSSSSSRPKRMSSSNPELDAKLSWTILPSNLGQKISDVTGVIHQKANLLRQQPPVNWLPYLEAGLIGKNDYSFLSAFQQTKTREDRDKLLDYFKDDAFSVLVSVVQRVCIVEEIQKFLVLIDDTLWEDLSRVKRFSPCKNEPWKPFMDLLSCTDDFVRNISSRIITKFIIVECCNVPKMTDIRFFLCWLKNELHEDNKYLLSVARCLQKLLRVDAYRLLFLNLNGIFRIIRFLCAGTKPQAQYQLVFCIWVSSFNLEIAEKLNKFNTIPVLIELLESCPAENVKLPRVILATFRNLLEKPREEGVKKHNALVMIQCKLTKFLDILKVRLKNIDDRELDEDHLVIDDTIKKYTAELSTFDEYKLELISGRLEWSVVHTSKPFWSKNAARLNESKYELLKILVSLLEISQESTVLCVAAHDIGEYMTNYARGKKVVEELGGKDALLRLLSDQHPVVKYHALKSLQILMLNNYDLLIECITHSKSGEAVMKWGNLENFGL